MLKTGLPGRTRSASRPDPPCQKRSARAPNDFPLGRHPKPSAGEAIPGKCPKRGFLSRPRTRSALASCPPFSVRDRQLAGEERFARPSMRCVPVAVCASSMVCAGGVCQLCAAARSRRLLIKQAVLPPNPDQTTRARCCRLVLGAYLANFSGFFFALFFFRDHCSWLRLKRIRRCVLGS